MTENINESTSTQTTTKELRWYHPRIWWVYIPLSIFATVILAFNIIQPITVLPRIELAPGYLLYNQDDKPVTSESLRGQLTMYTFSYTSCEDNCPQTMDDIAYIYTALEEGIPSDVNLSFITISLDPEYDTPEMLKARLDEYEMGDKVEWQFLVGDPFMTKYAIGSGFGFYYGPKEQEDGGYIISHQPRYILVDGWGMVRSEYGVRRPDIDILIRDLNLLTDEAHNSTGSATIAYEAAHLFLCYP